MARAQVQFTRPVVGRSGEVQQVKAAGCAGGECRADQSAGSNLEYILLDRAGVENAAAYADAPRTADAAGKRRVASGLRNSGVVDGRAAHVEHSGGNVDRIRNNAGVIDVERAADGHCSAVDDQPSGSAPAEGTAANVC